MYTAGASTRSTVTRSWIGSLACTPYLLAVKSVEFFTPDLPMLLNNTWTTLFACLAVGSTMVALSTTRACMKAAVLTADGQCLRLYPYGSLGGWGFGTPVTVPIKLLGENAAFALAKRDPDAIFVRVRSAGPGSPWSKSHLVFDIPPSNIVAREPGVSGSGLIFTPKGVAPESASRLFQSPPSSSSPSSIATTTPALSSPTHLIPLHTPADRLAQRTYALFAWVLQGNTVGDMGRVVSGDWSLERMGQQLGEGAVGGRGSKGALVASQASQWRVAKVGEGGEREGGSSGGGQEVYYYNYLTWETSWEPPPGWGGGVGVGAGGQQRSQS